LNRKIKTLKQDCTALGDRDERHARFGESDYKRAAGLITENIVN
jgi:hypothetical protein